MNFTRSCREEMSQQCPQCGSGHAPIWKERFLNGRNYERIIIFLFQIFLITLQWRAKQMHYLKSKNSLNKRIYYLCTLLFKPTVNKVIEPAPSHEEGHFWLAKQVPHPPVPSPLSQLWSSLFNFRSPLTFFHFRHKVPVPRLTARCPTKEPSIPTFWPSPGLCWRRAGRLTAQVSWPTCWIPSAPLWRPSPLLSGRLGLQTCKKYVKIMILNDWWKKACMHCSVWV